MKKALSFILTIAMVLTMGASVFAEGTTTATNKITAPSDGHTYEIYQIFTGDLSGTTLSNVKWGKNGTGTEGEKVASDTLKAVAAISGTNIEKASAISAYVNLTSDPIATLTNGASYDAAAGYYLIKDKDGSVGDGQAYTLYIVQIVGDITITPKTGVPELVKKVQDVNDSTGDKTGWQDSADYDINDDIPYQLTATMGDLSNYSHYYVEFTDTMSEGLTYKEITSVKVGDTELTKDQYTATWNDQVLKVVINDVVEYGATTGTKVVVEYTATLNGNAVIGSAGNPNTAYLTYSNNPNNVGDGTSKPSDTGNTPEDKNIVFTYKVVANKINEAKEALVGASFKLEKLDSKGNVIEGLGTIDGTNTSKFEWKGIDDGIYKITETVTPPGYNTISPITFTVTAEHDVTADNPTLTKLSGNTFTGAVSTGALTASIENKSGSVLPTTGGMGTTMLYIFGIMMVLGAGVLLIARKKMAK